MNPIGGSGWPPEATSIAHSSVGRTVAAEGFTALWSQSPSRTYLFAVSRSRSSIGSIGPSGVHNFTTSLIPAEPASSKLGYAASVKIRSIRTTGRTVKVNRSPWSMERDETRIGPVRDRCACGRSGEGRMTTTRLLSGVLVALATAGSGLAQDYADSPSAPSRYPLIPPVGPVEPVTRPVGMPPGRPYAATGLPPARPFATPTTALDRVTAPIQQVSGEQSDPVGALTGQPAVPTYQAMGLPPGAYPSPFFTDGPGCCGPLGRDGRVGYELYVNTGPTWAIGEGEFTRR